MRANFRDPLLIQAVIAAALSFAHIHDIADASGQAGWKAWAYPVSLDLLVVMAWKQIREAGDGESTRAARLWFYLSLAASLSANVVTSGVVDLENPPATMRVLVAGWPVLAFFGGSLLVHSRKTHAEEAHGEPQTPAEEPAEEATKEEDSEPADVDPRPVLVTYAEAAEKLDVAPETVRGAAYRGRLAKYSGDRPGTVRVDLEEARRVLVKRPVDA
ncbi:MULTISPECIES: DUF2637 domain-containing protein [unclassified Streptomyces]|uniref:DUF2637 domain-containing protein n=1 Tax=unclassified Streptomyces TaxID=2593676 RepID=UPI0033D15E93